MEFGVLGPLLVRVPGGPVILGSAKQRALLATLLLETASGLVPAERLIDELWGDDPPATAGTALQVHVSQLRRALGAISRSSPARPAMPSRSTATRSTFTGLRRCSPKLGACGPREIRPRPWAR
jgi:DNA-binding SARP family transcriptional activator